MYFWTIYETILFATTWKQEIISKNVFQEEKHICQVNYKNTRFELFLWLFSPHWTIYHLILLSSCFFVFCSIWRGTGLVGFNRFSIFLYFEVKKFNSGSLILNLKYSLLTYFEPPFKLWFTGLPVSHNHNNVRLTLCRTSQSDSFYIYCNMWRYKSSVETLVWFWPWLLQVYLFKNN